MSTGSERNGFTLLELMVSIGIIGLLLSVLVPAVQKARESARRSQCQNNLRQICLGMLEFHDAHQHFPGPGPTHLPLLPFLEQTQLQEVLSKDSTALNASPPVVRCPTDSQAVAQFQTVSYLFNEGNGEVGGSGFETLLNGVFERITPSGMVGTRLRDFTDGTSNTAILAEKLVVPILNRGDPPNLVAAQSDQRRYVWYLARDHDPTVEPIETIRQACADNAGIDFQPMSFPVYDALSSRTTGYNHVSTPNTPSCYHIARREFPVPFSFGPMPPTSQHDSVVAVGFADGHVRFVQEEIDARIWYAVGTRNGGEVVSDF